MKQQVEKQEQEHAEVATIMDTDTNTTSSSFSPSSSLFSPSSSSSPSLPSESSSASITTLPATSSITSILPQYENEKKELHIAPMLDYSKREFRKLFSIMSTKLSLWTDMIVDETIVHSDKLPDIIEGDSLPSTNNKQIFQIGSNDPKLCGEAICILLQKQQQQQQQQNSNNTIYSEINLNMDCPSPRVSGERSFGASLMLQAQVAYDVMESIQTQLLLWNNNNNNNNNNNKLTTPSVKHSIKCRIAVDDEDETLISDLIQFLRPVCRRFILHARKCVLCGLMSARHNRSVPPLNYPRVYQLCHMFPDCEFWINGGIRTLEDAKAICYGPTNNNNNNNNDNTKTTTTTNNNKIIDNTVSQQQQQHQQQHYQIPCPICDHPNGSCTAPPSSSACCLTNKRKHDNDDGDSDPLPQEGGGCGIGGAVPSNLIGCMMGRAAMDHPALFADADRTFFGLDSNPCQNRRQVLEKYCQYLEDLYPRRCCDDNDEITYKLPVPIVERRQADGSDYCSICREMYFVKTTTTTTTTTKCKGDDGREDEEETTTTINNNSNNNNNNNKAIKVKVAARIVGRSLKPVRGIFYGLPRCKLFIKTCDQLGQDKRIRNCGPGFILRKAMQVMPDTILDEPFVK